MVLPRMLAMTEQAKVGRVIIEGIVIQVVYMFIGTQRTAKALGHQPSMFIRPLACRCNLDEPVYNAIPRCVKTTAPNGLCAWMIVPAHRFTNALFMRGRISKALVTVLALPRIPKGFAVLSARRLDRGTTDAAWF